MRYKTASSDFFCDNRQALGAALDSGCVAVVQANDVLPTGADGTLPFHQNSDLYYLTGVDQDETVLLLFPDAFHEADREILFVRETNEHIAVWEGAKLTKEQATELSGVSTVRWISEFDDVFRRLMIEGRGLYLNTNEHLRASVEVQTRGDRFIRRVRDEFPLHPLHRLAPLITAQRMIKSEPEIALLQKACDITEAGFRRVLGFLKPGVTEYQIEAEFMHEFLMAGSRGFAYSPIIASGMDNCVLHYLVNDKTCAEGDLVLLDVAAEYAYYNADMTRTIPVTGRYSPRQRDVYQAVLRVMRESDQLLRPGVMLKEYEKEIGKVVEAELIQLGLLERSKVDSQDPDKPLYKKYFMHGTSHHLGIDVHDVGLANSAVAEGMVFTVEPGIYIPDEGFGVRLENDIVIGADSNFDLMANIPIEVEEIEDLMNL